MTANRVGAIRMLALRNLYQSATRRFNKRTFHTAFNASNHHDPTEFEKSLLN